MGVDESCETLADFFSNSRKKTVIKPERTIVVSSGNILLSDFGSNNLVTFDVIFFFEKKEAKMLLAMHISRSSNKLLTTCA